MMVMAVVMSGVPLVSAHPGDERSGAHLDRAVLAAVMVATLIAALWAIMRKLMAAVEQRQQREKRAIKARCKPGRVPVEKNCGPGPFKRRDYSLAQLARSAAQWGRNFRNAVVGGGPPAALAVASAGPEGSSGLTESQLALLDRIVASENQSCMRGAAEGGDVRPVVVELVRLLPDLLCAAFLKDDNGAAMEKDLLAGGELPSGLAIVRPTSSEEERTANLGAPGHPAVYMALVPVAQKKVKAAKFVGADGGMYLAQRRRFQREHRKRVGAGHALYAGAAFVHSAEDRIANGHMKNDKSANTFQSIARTVGWQLVQFLVLFSSADLIGVKRRTGGGTSLYDITHIAESFAMVPLSLSLSLSAALCRFSLPL
jgi:hypothetical protein